jgi:uncharacterized protein
LLKPEKMSLLMPDLSWFEWFQFALCGMLLGMSKTGLSGAGLIVVPVMAVLFGGKNSVAIVLPMLLIADVFAVSYYHRHANWKYIIRLIPWALLGILVALVFGVMINDEQFKQTIAVLVITGIVLMVWMDIRRRNLEVPGHWWFAALLGMAGGFTSMIGNAAGPVFTLYLLSMRLPKKEFIGTGAWFYFILNLMKLPFHIFVWKTITLKTLVPDLIISPSLFIGAMAGIWLVKLIPDKAYRIFIIASTLVASFFLF